MSEIQEILAAAVKKNRSLYRVAQLCDVAYTTAHRWKKGKAEPQGRHLIKVMKLAGKSFLFVILTSTITNWTASDARADVRPGVNTSIHYTQFRAWLRRLLQSARSCPSPA